MGHPQWGRCSNLGISRLSRRERQPWPAVPQHREGLAHGGQIRQGGRDSQRKGARRRSDAPSQGIFYSSMSSYSREPMPSAAAASTMRTPLRDSMRSNRWARPGSLEA